MSAIQLLKQRTYLFCFDLATHFFFQKLNRRYGPSLRKQPSSLVLAAGDVLQGRTSATQRQKFHTVDVKSVQNPVTSADWTTEQLDCFSYCLLMKDRRQEATKVKCKQNESTTKHSLFVEFILLQKKNLSLTCWNSTANEPNSLP